MQWCVLTLTYTHTCKTPNFSLAFSIISSISEDHFHVSHSSLLSPLGHQNNLEYFQSRISVLKYIPTANRCLLKSYTCCSSLKGQFQFSQEHSNLKEASHFVLWHEKKIILTMPIKRCECHFYIFVLFRASKSRAQNKVTITLLKLRDFHNIPSGTQVFQNNCKYLIVFSITGYIIYIYFYLSVFYIKPKQKKAWNMSL